MFDSVSTSDPLANPYYHSLRTIHAGLALSNSLATRFPADVIPFAALAEPTPEALSDLHALLAPEESIYVTADTLPPHSGLELQSQILCWQMLLTVPPPAPTAGPTIESLDLSHADELLALTAIAFPGFVRRRTAVLGRYFGVRHNGELIAMAGERLALPGMREVSGVCTHPAHTGKGLAAHLIGHILRLHAAEGLQSFLHASAVNERALQLYDRLGFTRTRQVLFHRLRHKEQS